MVVFVHEVSGLVGRGERGEERNENVLTSTQALILSFSSSVSSMSCTTAHEPDGWNTTGTLKTIPYGISYQPVKKRGNINIKRQ